MAHRLLGLLIILPLQTDSGLGSPSSLGTSDSSAAMAWDSHQKLIHPYFVNSTGSLVVTSQGQPAYLHCQVANSGDRKVSWMRARDLKILTIGLLTYTSDARFVPLHSVEASPETWTLKIQRPELADTGEYECQVAHHDDMETKLTQSFSLKVLDTRAELSLNTEIYVKPGSALQLECRVLNLGGKLPSYLYWYHDNVVINYGAQKTEEVLISTREDFSVSSLWIAEAQAVHSGNYTCAPQFAASDSVLVHVTLSENPAAMLNHGHGSPDPSTILLIIPLFLFSWSTRALPSSSSILLFLLLLFSSHPTSSCFKC